MTIEEKVDSLLDKLEVDGNMGYDYGSTSGLITELVTENENLREKLGKLVAEVKEADTWLHHTEAFAEAKAAL